jgi:hypothetical protein
MGGTAQYGIEFAHLQLGRNEAGWREGAWVTAKTAPPSAKMVGGPAGVFSASLYRRGDPPVLAVLKPLRGLMQRLHQVRAA